MNADIIEEVLADLTSEQSQRKEVLDQAVVDLKTESEKDYKREVRMQAWKY